MRTIICGALMALTIMPVHAAENAVRHFGRTSRCLSGV
jgi:hypothetical protein